MKKCWIAGSVFLVVVVVSLGVFIPWINQKISCIQGELAALNYKREIRLMNYTWFLCHGIREGQSLLEIYLLKLLNEHAKIPEAKEKQKKRTLDALSKLHVISTGDIASQKLMDKWDTMNRAQLLTETKPLIENQNLSEFNDNIKKKKSELADTERFRILVIVWTTVAQVIGLFVISVSQYFKDYKKRDTPNNSLERT